LFDGFLKAWLSDSWGAPSLELNVFRIVQSMSEEDGGEVNIFKVATSEVSCAVSGKVLDPLCARGEVALWIVRV
jgi:hypothetical protein